MKYEKNTLVAFLELLKAGLWPEHGKLVSLDTPVNWNMIYQLASKQSVLGLVLAGSAVRLLIS